MKIDLDQLQKLSDLQKLEQAPASVLGTISPEQVITAIVQVAEPDYVPDGVTVRARIDSNLFTAEFAAVMLPALEDDPRVTSVALSRRQEMIE